MPVCAAVSLKFAGQFVAGLNGTFHVVETQTDNIPSQKKGFNFKQKRPQRIVRVESQTRVEPHLRSYTETMGIEN